MQQVNAHCNVTLSITEGIAEVSKHSCNTEPVSAEKVIRMCPDCPVLLPLHSPEGLESVKAGLRQFNMDHNYTSYFKLMEVGRIISGYMMMTGMYYNAELAIVETECNAKSRIDTQACKPLCPDEAVRQLATLLLLILTPHVLPSSYSGLLSPVSGLWSLSLTLVSCLRSRVSVSDFGLMSRVSGLCL
ncbi:alpha-2-HS-glycoprotein 1 [Salvelinus sp. IW2-2015]|uniref:alpha-2-HS-glycoprotein 1 n=1 Tax=Salvelinus sp. IW2-2015 TaxID=2691554 RepID=UPI000CEB200D|nr:alpha-2-HS-glycoprotein-like [Salvelinus alpinus]